MSLITLTTPLDWSKIKEVGESTITIKLDVPIETLSTIKEPKDWNKVPSNYNVHLKFEDGSTLNSNCSIEKEDRKEACRTLLGELKISLEKHTEFYQNNAHKVNQFIRHALFRLLNASNEGLTDVTVNLLGAPTPIQTEEMDYKKWMSKFNETSPYEKPDRMNDIMESLDIIQNPANFKGQFKELFKQTSKTSIEQTEMKEPTDWNKVSKEYNVNIKFKGGEELNSSCLTIKEGKNEETNDLTRICRSLLSDLSGELRKDQKFYTDYAERIHQFIRHVLYRLYIHKWQDVPEDIEDTVEDEMITKFNQTIPYKGTDRINKILDSMDLMQNKPNYKEEFPKLLDNVSQTEIQSVLNELKSIKALETVKRGAKGKPYKELVNQLSETLQKQDYISAINQLNIMDNNYAGDCCESEMGIPLSKEVAESKQLEKVNKLIRELLKRVGTIMKTTV